jgi:hypothetical protein
MIPDFIDSMWCLSQFHSNCIIIPQTPFSKGGLRIPHSRDCGVLKTLINATEAAIAFSEIINSVKYKGEGYTIIRGGKPVAAIVPTKIATTG